MCMCVCVCLSVCGCGVVCVCVWVCLSLCLCLDEEKSSGENRLCQLIIRCTTFGSLFCNLGEACLGNEDTISIDLVITTSEFLVNFSSFQGNTDDQPFLVPVM